MPLRIIGSPEPGYLSATDILISDMSNINYDFLLFNRPIVSLANEWLRKNFPDFGIKTDLENIESAISRAKNNPGEYAEARKFWLEKSIYRPDGHSSERVLKIILERAKIDDPYIILLHGNNEVGKVHLVPLYKEIVKKNLKVEFESFFSDDKLINNKKFSEKNLIIISTHNQVLNNILSGYKVHIDHSVKGEGVTDFENLLKMYEKMSYFPNTDLHVTEGETSFERTRKIVGPFTDRVVLAGYPKSDTLLEKNTAENKNSVYKELGFDYGKILVTYAPTGKYSYPFKQGASLTPEVIRKLKTIAKKNEYNVLIKLRSSESNISKIIKKIRQTFLNS
jgi:CDP-glycerol glycerophosphotransferase (TagB/SpsB family)